MVNMIEDYPNEIYVESELIIVDVHQIEKDGLEKYFKKLNDLAIELAKQETKAQAANGYGVQRRQRILLQCFCACDLLKGALSDKHQVEVEFKFYRKRDQETLYC